MLNHGDTQKNDAEQAKLIEERQQILDWLNEVCGAAFAEARKGNLALISRLGKHDSLAYYINNVITRNAISPEQFARQYPAYLEEARQIRAEYLALQEAPKTAQKTNELAEQLATLKGIVEQQAKELKELREAQAKPAKPAESKKGKKADQPAESESEASDEAE